MTPAPRRRGPRSGAGDTRTAVLDAARRRFAEHGYDGTKLRDVAADAGVDVALVSYFFGSKDGLFAAAMELQVSPADVVAQLVADGVEGLGERLVRRLLAVLGDPAAGAPLVALVRSAATHDEAAATLRGFVERAILGRLATAIDAPDPELRAALCGSQVVGLVMARYVVGVAPLAEADPGDLAAAIGPSLERYLTGDLTATSPPPAPRRRSRS
jgi:AcrR family transcriptional regulator